MNPKRSIAAYILAYLLWFISTGLSLGILFLIRQTFLLSLVVSAMNRSQMSESELFYYNLQGRAADEWSMLGVGAVLVMLLVFFENIYRISVPKGNLWNRFTLITAIQLGVLFLVNVVYFFLSGRVRPFFWGFIYIPVLEVIATAAFVWFYTRLHKRPES